jgi:hypothetical protein
MERTEMPPSPPDEGARVPGNDYQPCRPTLPAGYQAQQAWGFRGPDGEFFYEFSRVYGPAVDRDGRGPIAQLDQDLSYWSVIWPITGQTGDEHPAGRWMTFAQARQLQRHLSFERFSKMREELPALFRRH